MARNFPNSSIVTTRLNRRHPLFPNLVGAWKFDVGGYAEELVYDQAVDRIFYISALGLDKPRIAPSGPSTIDGSFPRVATATTPSANLKRADRVSIFWYGTIVANENSLGSANPAVCGIYNNTSNAAPYVCYTINRPNNTDLWAAYNTGGVFGNIVATSVIGSGEYERPMSLSASFGTDSVRLFKNGIQVQSGAGISGTTYGATALLVTGWNPSTNHLAGTCCSVMLIFNTPLIPTSHLALAQDPYQMFDNGLNFVGRNDIRGSSRSFVLG